MMEISDKYKQTELGPIPEDWNIVEFQEVMDGFSSGQTPYRGQPEFYTGNIPWITSGELNYNVITDTKEKITPEGVQEANLKIIPKGTFLFAITGLEAAGTRGSCAITGIEATTNQSCMALYPKKGLLITPYLYHFYVRYGNDLAFKYCQGTKQQSYTGGIAKKLPIIVPPSIEEQTAIATALSDADALISSLEKLIAKKRMIKQGAMQQLLQTKEGDALSQSKGWEVKKLGEILSFGSGKDYKNLRIGDIPVYGTGGIMTYVDGYLYEGESVGIGRKGTIDNPVYLTGKFWTVDTLFFTHQFKNAIPKFVYYLFCLIKWTEYNEASGVPSLNKKTLENIEVQIPSTEEQTRIATILSDMDAEIAALEAKLEKYKKVKLGMMQNLLTGKIRLV